MRGDPFPSPSNPVMKGTRIAKVGNATVNRESTINGEPVRGRDERLSKANLYQQWLIKWMDAPRGFEQRLTKSESVVLPVDDGAAWEAARQSVSPSRVNGVKYRHASQTAV